VTSDPRLRAVLFDLDDTLFDHSGCARAALDSVYRAHVCGPADAFDGFVRLHSEHLESLHREVLAGTIDLDAARIERFRRVLLAAGGAPERAVDAAAMYRDRYMVARRAVRGAADVLAALHGTARIVIVSNNLLAEQRDKIEKCGLAPYVDALVVSEEAGVPKPDPEIFRVALDAAEASSEEAVMVGDSWAADIAGARASGIVPVWFNPAGLPAPASPSSVVELRSFVPAHAAIETIVQAHANRANGD
jgi:putative hydrolase of the HAD superfamily